ALVVAPPVLERDLAPDQVVEGRLALVGHLQPYHRHVGAVGLAPTLGLALAEAEAIVPWRLLAPRLLLAHAGEPLRRAPAAVGVAAGEQLLGVLPVDLAPLRLPVRPVRAADVRSLVPVELQPAQALEDRRLGRRVVPGPVGVLDPQDELAALLAGEGQVEERLVRAADVRQAGRR